MINEGALVEHEKFVLERFKYRETVVDFVEKLEDVLGLSNLDQDTLLARASTMASSRLALSSARLEAAAFFFAVAT